MFACLLLLLCIPSVPILTAQVEDSRFEDNNNEGIFYEADFRAKRSPQSIDDTQYSQNSGDFTKSQQIAQSYVPKTEPEVVTQDDEHKDYHVKQTFNKKYTKIDDKYKQNNGKISLVKRLKREVKEETPKSQSTSTTETNALKREEKSLEVSHIDPGDLDLMPQLEPEDNAGVQSHNVVINDYIRFKRNSDPNFKQIEFVSNDGKEAGTAIQLGNPKRSIAENDSQNIDRIYEPLNIDQPIMDSKSLSSSKNCADQQDDIQRAKRHPEGSGVRTARMLMEPEEAVDSSPREPRGPTTTQWVKNRYPVDSSSASNSQQHQQSSSSSLDSASSASDTFRAPRVHFVTQRRSESSPPPVIRPYEREGRARDVERDWRNDYRSPPSSRDWRDYDRFLEPPMTMPSYYRRYDPLPRYERPYYRQDELDRPYDRYDSRRYPPPPGSTPRSTTYYDRYDAGPRSSRNNNRIIYYTTLPEVTRRPSAPGYRSAGGGRYDPPSAASPDGYRYRKSSYYDHKGGGYEQNRDVRDGSKVPYPVKVSANVNVRDAVKKNPELRIYSETDRSRYAYKAPGSYQAEESYNNRQA